MWDAIYDCLFFCINQDIYDGLTPEQQAVVDECGQKAVEYERYINRSSDNEIKERWESKNGVTFTEKADMDIDSFKEAVDTAGRTDSMSFPAPNVRGLAPYSLPDQR